jgi:magnesium transporter
VLVVYGATSAGHLVEVHCFYDENYLVTVHHEPCPDLDALADRLRHHGGPRPDHVMLLYQVLDTLADSYFPVLASLDDQIDELEDQILRRRPSSSSAGCLI